MHNYTEITYTPWSKNDCLYRINAKKNENDELHTVAFVHRITGVVTYVDPTDENNPVLQKTIESIVKEINPKVSITDEQGTATMYCKTNMGTFVLQFEQDENTDCGYDGAFVGFRPDCTNNEDYFDLVAARVVKPDAPINRWHEKLIMLDCFGSPSTEDSTFRDYIFENHFKDAMDALDH